MTKDQLNKNYETALSQCRSEIDAIDSEILELFAKRMKIVAKVRQIKLEAGETFFIKSSREADMIKDLVAKADPILPRSMIAIIWRKLITSSNMLEQPLAIALHNPQKLSDYNYLLREYYADFVPITNHDSVNNVVLDIEKNNAQIAVFALPNHNAKSNFDNLSEDWWINLANNKAGLKVFAKIPLIDSTISNKAPEDLIELVALAIKKPEKSRDDNSLLCVELANSVAKSQFATELAACEIEAKILKSVKLKQVDDVTFHLVEARGFIDENNPNLQKFTKSKIKPFVKILGVYPTSV